MKKFLVALIISSAVSSAFAQGVQSGQSITPASFELSKAEISAILDEKTKNNIALLRVELISEIKPVELKLANSVRENKPSRLRSVALSSVGGE